MNDILSHLNFLSQSDFVFARNVYPEIPNQGEVTQLINTNLTVKDNDIIFSKYEFVPKLFEILRNKNCDKKLILISHESDAGVDENFFKSKPECIVKWYAQNVEYDHEDLIPIPLGVACDYYQFHSLTLSHINKETEKRTKNKLLYINHRISTHPSSREWIYNYFTTNDWCTVDQPNLSLDKYREKINSHKFILCPRGNGIDTIRLWESLYCGIIPIVEKHVHYNKCLVDLPVVIVDSFQEVTQSFLENKLIEMSNKVFNMEKLKVSWWIKLMKESM